MGCRVGRRQYVSKGVQDVRLTCWAASQATGIHWMVETNALACVMGVKSKHYGCEMRDNMDGVSE